MIAFSSQVNFGYLLDKTSNNNNSLLSILSFYVYYEYQFHTFPHHNQF